MFRPLNMTARACEVETSSFEFEVSLEVRCWSLDFSIVGDRIQ
jgi:hypothetical protein